MQTRESDARCPMTPGGCMLSFSKTLSSSFERPSKIVPVLCLVVEPRLFILERFFSTSPEFWISGYTKEFEQREGGSSCAMREAGEIPCNWKAEGPPGGARVRSLTF